MTAVFGSIPGSENAWSKVTKNDTGFVPRGKGVSESGKPTSIRKTVRSSWGKSTRAPKPDVCFG